MGEMINNYELLLPFQNKNAGFSRWTVARKAGKFYFIKQFLAPKYPTDDTLSEMIRNDMKMLCEKYEEKNKKFYETIGSITDGNIVKIHEFFRYDSHYYITTERIDGEKISFEEIAELPLEDRLLLCKTLAHSVMKLHEKKIIHADIKADNVMIKKTLTGNLVCKLIDFDCGFFEDNQPESDEELCGDQVYLSPEGCRFIFGEEVLLTTKMDVFAVGLLFHQYLTGKLPGFDTKEYDYAHQAVLDEQELVLSDELSDEHKELIKKMLLCDPDERCDMEEVFRVLSGEKEETTDFDDGDNPNDEEEDDKYKSEEYTASIDDTVSEKKDYFMMPDADDLM